MHTQWTLTKLEPHLMRQGMTLIWEHMQKFQNAFSLSVKLPEKQGGHARKEHYPIETYKVQVHKN